MTTLSRLTAGGKPGADQVMAFIKARYTPRQALLRLGVDQALVNAALSEEEPALARKSAASEPVRTRSAAGPRVDEDGLAGARDLSDEWLAVSADKGGLTRAGMKAADGGPPQSKTMMLAELALILSSGAADRAAGAVVRENLLGKPSMRAREAALYRLRQLYGIGEPAPICTVLQRLWDRNPVGRPMLALLCALARDPALLRTVAARPCGRSGGRRRGKKFGGSLPVATRRQWRTIGNSFRSLAFNYDLPSVLLQGLQRPLRQFGQSRLPFLRCHLS
jgi:hypothetical protein